MRRRDAKYNSKAYKALFDAFVESTRSGDAQLTRALSLAMQAIDPTGQLASIGQSYAQAPTSNVSLPYSTKSAVEFAFKFGMPYLKRSRAMAVPLEPSADGDVLLSPSSLSCSPDTPEDSDPQSSPATVTHDSDSQSRSGRSNTGTSMDAPTSFDEIRTIWANNAATGAASQIGGDLLPGFPCDPYTIKTDDPLSNAITSFRDGARHMINAGARVSDVIGDSTPCLDAFFGLSNGNNITAWSWACQIASASSHQSLTFQLALVYIAGIQMRVSLTNARGGHAADNAPVLYRPFRRNLWRLASNAQTPVQTIHSPPYGRDRYLPPARVQAFPVVPTRSLQASPPIEPELQLAI